MESSRCACWQIHTDELSCPLQCCCKDGLGWFKSISSAKKAKKSDQKSTHHLESRGCHPSIYQCISTPSTLLPWFHPLWVFVGTARPPIFYSCYAKTPNWQNQWPQYQIPKVPLAPNRATFGRDFFFARGVGSQKWWKNLHFGESKLDLLEIRVQITYVNPQNFVSLILFDADYLLAAGPIIELTFQDLPKKKRWPPKTAICNWKNTLDIYIRDIEKHQFGKVWYYQVIQTKWPF